MTGGLCPDTRGVGSCSEAFTGIITVRAKTKRDDILKNQY